MMLVKMLLEMRSLLPIPTKRKFLVTLVPFMLAGQAAFSQSTYTSTNVPAALATDGYTRHNASLGTTTSSAMVITYDDGGTIQAPVVPTTSNIKMLVSSSGTNFSTATFVQADTVNTIDKTVTFHPPAGSFYTLAISAAADLAIVTNGPASAAPGATITYKLEVTNTGPSDVQNAVVKMPNLSNFTVTSITASGIQFSHSATPTSVPASYPAVTDLQNTGITIPSIAAFGGVNILITGTAGSTVYSVIKANATVTMPAGMTDVNNANNTSTFSTPIFTPGALSRYAFDKTATLAELGGAADPATAQIDAAGNYNFNIVYTLMSGDTPVAPFGTTLKIPATVSAMANKANGAVNLWRGAGISASNVLYIQPYIEQGDPAATPYLPGISLLENLPYVNTRGPLAATIIAVDPFMHGQISSGFYVPLGIYNLVLGAVPAATDPHVAVVNATTIVRGSGNIGYTSVAYSEYGSRNLGVTTIADSTTTSSSAPPDTVRPNATYPIVYHGFVAQIVPLFGKDRGYRIDDGMVTFTTLAQPLPLHLLSFTGQQKNNANVLSWTTSMEENTRSFDVERSADGNNFTAIGNKAAAGNSTTMRQYTYNDATAGDDAFYRLRMNNADGSFTYSAVIHLSDHAPATGDVAIGDVYPVPFSDVLNVAISSGKDQQAVVQLYSMNGSLAAQYAQPLAKGNSTYQLGGAQFAGLVPGMYILSVKTDNGVVTKEVTKK